mgnify:CR=1 FL=1
MSVRTVFFICILTPSPVPAMSMQLAGMGLPDEVRIRDFDGRLPRNGADVHGKCFIDIYVIYVGASDRPLGQVGVGELLPESSANRVATHFGYSEVVERKLAAVWQDYVPGRGAEERVNGARQGVIGVADFNSALLAPNTNDRSAQEGQGRGR